MITLKQLYERCQDEGIEVDERCMRELRAVSFPEGWIAIDRRRYRDDTDFKCDLAHEIGHIETGSFYNILTPFEIRERCEHKANKRAVQILMPVDDVRRAMRRGYRTPWAMAECFDVTQEFVEMAMEMYEGELLHDYEQDQLAAVLAAHGIVIGR